MNFCKGYIPKKSYKINNSDHIIDTATVRVMKPRSKVQGGVEERERGREKVFLNTSLFLTTK